MSPLKFTLVPALALLGTLAGTAAEARGPDVHWSVSVGAPIIQLPLPVLSFPVPAHVVVVPAPRPRHVVAYPYHAYPGHYREPMRWDVNGDGVPNRYDRLYNPVWDRNGDGIPDHRAHRRADHRDFRHHPHADRDHDGIPNRYDRRDGRFDDRTYRDERRGPR